MPCPPDNFLKHRYGADQHGHAVYQPRERQGSEPGASLGDPADLVTQNVGHADPEETQGKPYIRENNQQ
jgi:hypothetical protein